MEYLTERETRHGLSKSESTYMVITTKYRHGWIGAVYSSSYACVLSKLAAAAEK